MGVASIDGQPVWEHPRSCDSLRMMGVLPAGTIRGDIFDSPTFGALYARLRDQPRIDRISRVRGDEDSIGRAFSRCARAGYPVVLERLNGDTPERAEVEQRVACRSWRCGAGSPPRRLRRSGRGSTATVHVGLARRLPRGSWIGSVARRLDMLRTNASMLPLHVRSVFPSTLRCGRGPRRTGAVAWRLGSDDPAAQRLKRQLRDAPFRRAVDSSGAGRSAPRSRAYCGPREACGFRTKPQADLHRPDSTIAPTFGTGVAVTEIVRAGDLLYVPAGWSHHVEALEPSLMISYWVDPLRRVPAALQIEKLTQEQFAAALQLRYEVIFVTGATPLRGPRATDVGRRAR